MDNFILYDLTEDDINNSFDLAIGNTASASNGIFDLVVLDAVNQLLLTYVD